MNAKRFKSIIQSRKLRIQVLDQVTDDHDTTHIYCRVLKSKR